jgi:hypothetical protein
MSLINDALKRAKEVQPPNPPAAQSKAAMQPVDDNHRPVGLPIYFLPMLLAIVCGAGFFLWKGWDQTQRLTATTDVTTVVQAREVAPPIVPAETTEPDPGPPGIPVGRNFSLEDDAPTAAAVATPSSPSPTATALAEELPRFAGHSFKLQGIFYRPANPSAVINSKSVFVGDTISNAKVKAIDRQSVTLEYDGETKVLTFQ